MRPKKVEDIMSTALAVLYEDQTLDIAVLEMEASRIRHLPVVERRHPDRLVGLITHRDVLRHVGGGGHARDRDVVLRHFTAASIMRRDVETARTGELAADAARRMLERKVGCLPVLNEEDALVGIITEADFVQYAIPFLESPRSTGAER